jgi:hypothetical protein
MNNKQKEALVLSIVHWEENLENAKNGLEVKASSQDCECCRVFFHIFCKDCPISQYVDNDLCDNTPYMNVNRAIKTHNLVQTEETKIALVKAVENEVKFLKEVLVNE